MIAVFRPSGDTPRQCGASSEVDSSGDEVAEISGEGTDEVHSSALDYRLGSFVENLVLTGTADINGEGNEIANRITGNAGANILYGELGNDTLTGNDGADELRGDEGADSMVGGLGDDSYFVDDIGDRVVESSSLGGFDQVAASVSYTLGSNVEWLALEFSDDINATGNTLGNTITGNTGNNVLSGLVGNDTILGGSGDDLLLGGDGVDVIRMDIGIDTLVGGAGTDIFAILSPSEIGGLDVIADFNAAVNGDLLDLSDILSGFDPSSSNINDFVDSITNGDGTKIRVDIDGGGDSFVDLVNLVGVSTDVTGLLNNGNLILAD